MTFNHEQATIKASVLADALPWLKKFRGATVVIKYGGNAMMDDRIKASFAADIVFLHLAGLHPVIVHGGGPQINDMLTRLNITSEFKTGLRVTTPEVLDVVRMVLTGQVQREIVNLINRHGPFAVGVSGEDASLFEAIQQFVEHDGKTIDLGLVGEVTSVRADLVETLILDDLIPVVSSIAVGADGTVYNINADTAAAALAVALHADKLVMMTDVGGLYANYPDPNSVISELSDLDLDSMMPSLESGMIPKMGACLTAVRGGVRQAHVIDGRLEHSVMLEIFTDEGIGTMVYAAGPGELLV